MESENKAQGEKYSQRNMNYNEHLSGVMGLGEERRQKKESMRRMGLIMWLCRKKEIM